MKIYIEDGESLPAVQVLPDADSAPTGFTEATTITNVIRYAGKVGGYDYKAIRSKVQVLAATTGFTNLSTPEKELTSQWFAVITADRDTIYTTEEQILYGKIFHQSSTACREDRIDRAISEIYNRLATSEIDELIDDVSDLNRQYIESGREGTDEGDPEGLFDYIEGRATTTYASGGSLPGLKHKGWTPIGKTLDALVTDILDILKNGIIE